MGEMCPNFRLVESERVKDMDQLSSPTCEDTIQGAHFGGGLMGATRCTRSGLSGSHDSCWPVSGSEGPNRPFWAQSRPATALDQPHVPMPWIYGLGSHGGGLQCPLLAHPMVSRGKCVSMLRVELIEASPPHFPVLLIRPHPRLRPVLHSESTAFALARPYRFPCKWAFGESTPKFSVEVYKAR